MRKGNESTCGESSWWIHSWIHKMKAKLFNAIKRTESYHHIILYDLYHTLFAIIMIIIVDTFYFHWLCSAANRKITKSPSHGFASRKAFLIKSWDLCENTRCVCMLKSRCCIDFYRLRLYKKATKSWRVYKKNNINARLDENGWMSLNRKCFFGTIIHLALMFFLSFFILKKFLLRLVEA